jgi:hypothetical protein
MKYSDIIASNVGHEIDLNHASDTDKDRFCTAFEAQRHELYSEFFEEIVKKTGHEPSIDEVFNQIVERAKVNYFEPDELDQIAYAAGFTGIVK